MTKDSSSQTFTQVASLPKMIFLALMSVALCSFGPMSVFAPVPLTVIFLLYGRLSAFSTGLVSIGLMYGAAVALDGIPLMQIGIYLLAFFFSFMISEFIRRDISPVKGLMTSGLVIVMIIGALLVGGDRLSKTSVKEQISQSITIMMDQIKKQRSTSTSVTGDEERAFEDLVNNPERLANEIYTSLPMIVFLYTFFVLWVTLYVTLRNGLVWRLKVPYSYGLSDLTSFKAPEFLVYPLILSLILWIGADHGLPAYSEIIGKNLLYSLGVFYFFQGFGVYNDLLKHLKINGFMKTLFIAFTVLLAARFLALVGLFDLWFDFRKYFKNKKKDEGDTI